MLFKGCISKSLFLALLQKKKRSCGRSDPGSRGAGGLPGHRVPVPRDGDAEAVSREEHGRQLARAGVLRLLRRQLHLQV